MKGQAVKDKILDVASDLFYKQGYNLTGINQIIDESDIARASLYHHFKSKTDLLVENLRRADENYFLQLEKFLASFTDPKEKLLAMVDFRIALQKKLGFGGCRFMKSSLEISKEEEKKVLSITHANKEKLKKVIRGLVSQVNQKQILSDDLLTETIFLLLEGASLYGAVTKSSLSLKKSKKIIESLI